MPSASMSKRHLDLRHAARRRRDADQLEAAEGLVVGRHLALALEHVDAHDVLVVLGGREHLALRASGSSCCLSMIFVTTPPCVSTPSESGVTSSSRTSSTSPFSTPPWIAAPIATTSSGFTPLCGFLPKISATFSLHARHARHAADEDHLVDLLARAARRRVSAVSQGSTSASIRSATSASSCSRVSAMLRCFGPGGVGGDERQVDVGLATDESSCFARSAASFSRCSAIWSVAQVDARLLLELRDQVVDDALVEVLAAEVGVAVRAQHLEHAVADLEDRDVERAAAEVEDGDRLALVACRGRRRAPRRSAR